jgi:ribose/xylose/arabinose/galactoside ABC-type transport system permease subunit
MTQIHRAVSQPSGPGPGRRRRQARGQESAVLVAVFAGPLGAAARGHPGRRDLGGNQISPYYIDWTNFGFSISGTMEVAIMALAMTPIIITGDIDLSVESMVGLSGAVLGVLCGGRHASPAGHSRSSSESASWAASSTAARDPLGPAWLWS